MGIEEFISNRKVVEDKLKVRDVSDDAYNIYLAVSRLAEQIKATNINKPGYTPADMKSFLMEVYNGLKMCAMQKRNAELIKEFNTKLGALEG